ncbi:hypothetical protein ACFL0D_00805 [Thermoproteota archaeon]
MAKKDAFVEKLKEYSVSNGIETVVIASQVGKTALQVAEKLGKEIHVVSISEFTYSENIKKQMKKLKITPVENADLPIHDIKEMRETLMMFDQGMKAALEVASIAASSELVNGDFVTVAGTRALDTAILVSTLHPESEMISEPLKQLKVNGIISSPLLV